MMYGELVEKFTDVLNSPMGDEEIKKTLFSFFKEASTTCQHYWTEQDFYQDVYTKIFYPGKERTATAQRYMQERLDRYTTMFSAWWYLVSHCDFRYNLRGLVEIF